MPYRRLPNTDAARIRALQSAIDACSKVKPEERAFVQNLLIQAKYFLNSFKSGISQNRSAHSLSVEKGASFAQLHRKMKMYISHFIQVLNMSIARGEVAASVREFYGVDKKLPVLETSEDLLEWGQKLIDGEKARREASAGKMENPRIELLDIIYKKYIAAARENGLRISHDQRSTEYTEDLRKQADEMIAQIWNEVEAYFATIENPEERRQECSKYGIVYVFRKSELEKEKNNTEEPEENTNN